MAKNDTEIVDLLYGSLFQVVPAELGWQNSGMRTAQELTDLVVNNSSAETVLPLVRLVKNYGDRKLGHELLHCFDVAQGAVELLKQLQDAGIPEQRYFPHTTEDAFLAGVLHDLALGLMSGAFGGISGFVVALRDIIKPDYHHLIDGDKLSVKHSVFKRHPLYNKGSIEDDVFGAALLSVTGLGLRNNVRVSLLSSVDAHTKKQLTVETKDVPQVQKVLDAIWYHDGNDPIRGFAEAEMLVGTRLSFYDARLVTDVEVEKGLDKLLAYTQDSVQGNTLFQWQSCSRLTNPLYLDKMVEKKAPGFIGLVKGTTVYDFMVEELTPQGRSYRTLRSPAFLDAFFSMPEVLDKLEDRQELKTRLQPKIDELRRRYEAVKEQIKAHVPEHYQQTHYT